MAKSSSNVADLADVRTLAVALHGAMHVKGSFGPKTTDGGISQSWTRRLISAEGVPRKILGKHVVVSLGARGVLWCGPKEAIMLRRPGSVIVDSTMSSKTYNTSGHGHGHGPATILIDDYTGIKIFSPVAIDPALIVNSSGAGDALFAGIVHAMMATNCSQLDSECIDAGLLAATKALTNTASVAAE